MFMKKTVSFLSTLTPDRVRRALYVFQKTLWGKYKTVVFLLALEQWKFHLNLNVLLVFQIQNNVTVAHFVTRLTPTSSKISSPVFFCQPQIANIFQKMNIIKKQMFIIFS